jgi:hypothetical protein
LLERCAHHVSAPPGSAADGLPERRHVAFQPIRMFE